MNSEPGGGENLPWGLYQETVFLKDKVRSDYRESSNEQNQERRKVFLLLRKMHHQKRLKYTQEDSQRQIIFYHFTRRVALIVLES